MSAFKGKQYRGAMRDRRALKRRQAVSRNGRTLPENRSRKREWKAAGL